MKPENATIQMKATEQDVGLWLSDLTVSQIVSLKIVEAVTLIEDSMDKLQQYGEELAETCEKHFPDLKRRVPEFKRRESNSVEKLKNSSQKQVRFCPVTEKSVEVFYNRNCFTSKLIVSVFHKKTIQIVIQTYLPPKLKTVKYRLVFKFMCMYISRHVGVIVIFQIVYGVFRHGHLRMHALRTCVVFVFVFCFLFSVLARKGEGGGTDVAIYQIATTSLYHCNY